jgi:monovalent cation/hydrogen antiporter
MLDKIELVLALMAAVAALTVLGRRVPVSFPILLVVAGLFLSLIPGLPTVQIDPNLVFLIFLPPMLYPAALFMPLRDFHANLRPILLLAIGLVLFTTVAIGYIAHYLIPGLPLAAGFALGAIVSPPDAIAATAIAERLRVPHRIVTVLEGESLVNDATALVAFRFAVAAISSGTIAWGRVTAEFFLVALGGIAVGLAAGYVTTWMQKRIDDPPVEITLSLLTPFAAYLPAERFGVSGVLAVVTAGLYHGWQIPEITSSRTRLQAGPVWAMVEFLLNGFIFILIGLQLPAVLSALAEYSTLGLLWYATAISLAVILIRIIWVFPAAYLPRLLWPGLRQRDPYPSWRNVAVVAWTGMRGMVSLAAALAIPLTTQAGNAFPARSLILFLTFSVIIATLVVQGLTLPPLIRWLGVEDDHSMEREERLARLKANQAALKHLDGITKASPIDPRLLERLRAEYEDRVLQLESETWGRLDGAGLFSVDYDTLAHRALCVERETLLHLRNERIINDEVLRRIQRDIDLAEARLSYRQSC